MSLKEKMPRDPSLALGMTEGKVNLNKICHSERLVRRSLERSAGEGGSEESLGFDTHFLQGIFLFINKTLQILTLKLLLKNFTFSV